MAGCIQAEVSGSRVTGQTDKLSCLCVTVLAGVAPVMYMWSTTARGLTLCPVTPVSVVLGGSVIPLNKINNLTLSVSQYRGGAAERPSVRYQITSPVGR